VEAASYIKLREVSLAWQVPKKWLHGYSLTLSAIGRNLYTKTKYHNFDPESSQGNGNMSGGIEYFSLPQTRSFGFGLNIIF
jgi:hypothetical protein